MKFKDLINEAAWSDKQRDIIDSALERMLAPFGISKFKNYPQKVYITFDSETSYAEAKTFVMTGEKPAKKSSYIKGDYKSMFDSNGSMAKFYNITWKFDDKKKTMEILYKFNKTPEGKLIHLSGPLYRHELAKLKGDITEGSNYKLIKDELVYSKGEDKVSIFSAEPGYLEVQFIYNEGDSFQEIIKTYKDLTKQIDLINDNGEKFPYPSKKEFEKLTKMVGLNEAKSKYTWEGGSDAYADARKIEKLLDGFNFYSHMIHSYPKQQKAEENNRYIKDELKKLGVTSFMLKGDKTKRVTEASDKYKFLGKSLKAKEEITNDKKYDLILKFDEKTYQEAEKKVSILVASEYVWKVNYNEKDYIISIKWEK